MSKKVQVVQATLHKVMKYTFCRSDPHKRYSAADDISMMSRRVIQASKRPTSMAVPLPSWATNGEEDGITGSSQSIAASYLYSLVLPNYHVHHTITQAVGSTESA